MGKKVLRGREIDWGLTGMINKGHSEEMTHRYLHIPYLQNCRSKPEAVTHVGFPWRLSSKKKILLPVPANEGDAGSAPGSGIYPGEGNGNPLQDSCLGNPMDRAAWQATVQGVAKSQT